MSLSDPTRHGHTSWTASFITWLAPQMKESACFVSVCSSVCLSIFTPLMDEPIQIKFYTVEV